MSSRLPALFSVFLASALLTRAGLAGASNPDQGPPDETRLPAEIAWRTPVDLRDSLPTQTDGRSWPEQITHRLDVLDQTRHTSTALSPDLQARVAAIAGRLPASVGVGIEVRDLEHDTTIASFGGGRALAPASTHKLITAIAAVELLGSDYVFSTRVYRAGDTLILRGEGDPDLQLEDVEQLVDDVVRRGHGHGIRRILVDDTAFSSEHFGPGYASDGPGDSYRAPSGALAMHWSTVMVSVAPTRPGEPVAVDLMPTSPLAVIDSTAVTSGSTPLHIDTVVGADGTTIVEVRGSLPMGYEPRTLRRRVADPGLFTAGAFAHVLGQRIGEPSFDPVIERAATPTDAELVALHESEPLTAVLASALTWSNNFTAEQVLRTLAWRATGEPGDWAQGVEVLARFAAAVSPDQAALSNFVNGSGLAREGRTTPRLLVDVVALGERPGSPAARLRSSMACAGEGTMRGRGHGAGERLRAKTGTYAGASGLAGFVRDPSGERTLGFAILMNGGDTDQSRAVQDSLTLVLLQH